MLPRHLPAKLDNGRSFRALASRIIAFVKLSPSSFKSDNAAWASSEMVNVLYVIFSGLSVILIHVFNSCCLDEAETQICGSEDDCCEQDGFTRGRAQLDPIIAEQRLLKNR